MRSGVPADAARQINLIARGHPLALSMAASIVLSDDRRTVEEAGHQVIEALSMTLREQLEKIKAEQIEQGRDSNGKAG